MNAIEILMEEHESILTMIDISQNILSEENMDNLPINDLENLIDFIQNFADKYHHLKEEDILFQEMVNRGMSNENGPISVMLHEHNLGRTYIKHAIEGIKKFKSGNKTSIQQIRDNLFAYGSLLTNHIHKENNILYPMAANLLTEETLLKMGDDFEISNASTLNNEYFDKYLRMVEEFSNRYIYLK